MNPPQLGGFPLPFAVDRHGEARVAGTRVTLSALLRRYVQGDTVDDLHEAFPTVPLSEIHAVICYYLRARDEVAQWLAAHAMADDRVLLDVSQRFPQTPRATLVSRASP